MKKYENFEREKEGKRLGNRSAVITSIITAMHSIRDQTLVPIGITVVI